jgi:hypothetical protein
VKGLLTLGAGLTAGYVLGAKAGEERYESIAHAASQARQQGVANGKSVLTRLRSQRSDSSRAS